MYKKTVMLCMSFASMICLVACGGKASSYKMEDVTIEKIVEANSYEKVLENHGEAYYDTKIYMGGDVDNGYLGYDHLIAKQTENGISMIKSDACQSVETVRAIEKNDDGNWIYKEQSAGEEIIESSYVDETAAMDELESYNLMNRENVISEQINDISEEDGAYVVMTTKTVKDEAAARVVYYWINPVNLELYAINETISTETDYGDILYVTTYRYDEEPDFNISFYY